MPSFSDEQIKAIGKRMHLYRNQAKLTQTQMARILNVSLSHYSKLEIGHGTIGPKMLQKIQQTGVPLEWLIDGIGEEPDGNVLAKRLRALGGIPGFAGPCSEADLIDILDIAMRPDLLKLSEEISDKTGISRNRALAMLVQQVMKSGQKNDSEAEDDEQTPETTASGGKTKSESPS